MTLRVLRPGLLTTVQDLGRRGWQHVGVTVGGAMDAFALRVANLLVGNVGTEAGLELTVRGPTLELSSDVLLALGGGDLGATLDGEPVPCWRPFAGRAGSVLSFEGARRGCRTYLCVAGGVSVPVVLGGRGTHLRARFGGLQGRALVEGDVLHPGERSGLAQRLLAELLAAAQPVAHWGAGPSLLPRFAKEPVVRIMPGPEHAHFTEESRRALVKERFEVTAQSDRMGYRLQGPALALASPLELVSSPVAEGTVQVPPGGAPIVLMADRQTTGGYPRIAQVVTVDLPLLAQATPGTRVRFRAVSLAEAQAALLARERALWWLTEAVRLRGR
ncbi:MAG: biotin-dependent carboxyltransferase family protein [Myxococcaceae bacterium]|nr:biotin-dependent carboxyltransferase family protein [Myxococcaceae bacterium]